MKIEIENSQEMIEIPENMNNLISETVKVCIESEGFTKDVEVSILFVDNETIREMNKEYRNIDAPTDVLSFPMLDIVEGKLKSDTGDYDISENVLLLGDIVISMEMAKIQAEEYGHTFERELLFLATHGTYHLLGYNHDTTRREKIMLQKQEAVLSKMGFERKFD